MLFIPFLVTCFACVSLKRISSKVGLLDMPGGRKAHGHPTPLVGGIAIYLGLLTGMLCLPFPLGAAYWGLIGAGFVILGIGVLDDLHDISARIRLLAQLIALGMMVFWGGVKLTHLGPLLGNTHIGLGKLGIPLTLFGAATLVNAMNMMDGLDGLAGSIALTMLTSLCGVALLSGDTQAAWVIASLIAAVMAFLCFNFPYWPNKKASLFMGDAGSTLLGFILAWFTIGLSQQPDSVASPAIMLWVVAVPLMDLAVVFLQRLKQGHSPFKPGNEHLYYLLAAKGLSRVQTTWLILGLTAASQVVAWIMIALKWPDAVVLSSFLVVFFLYLAWNMLQLRGDSH